ncbi:hypothetical protein [Piscinibacter sp.]|uniref:hypothetical protein n=1 Tax=Piscinibacter sp. TaxID=1903157 RepID=UPI00355A4212
MKLTQTLAALSLFGVIAVSSAFAADEAAPRVGGPVAEACRQDVQTLCAGAKPGDGRIKACMRENRAKLSDGCKAALKAQRGERKSSGK